MPLKLISRPQILSQVFRRWSITLLNINFNLACLYKSNCCIFPNHFYVFLFSFSFFLRNSVLCISKSQNNWNFRLVISLFFWGTILCAIDVSKYAYFKSTKCQVHNSSLFGDKSECLLALLNVPQGKNLLWLEDSWMMSESWAIIIHTENACIFYRYPVILCDLFLKAHAIHRITKLIYIIFAF